MRRFIFGTTLSSVLLLSLSGVNGEPNANPEQDLASKIHALETPDGIRFALLGEKPEAPAPTLLVLALDAEQTLMNPVYRRCGNQLAPQGFLCFSVDLPCHGSQCRADEPGGLPGWRKRIDSGDNPMIELSVRLKKVLDYLIDNHYTDPQRVVACGTSRGGFAALHFAAADPRVRCVAAYSPVTDLRALQEFQGVQSELEQQLRLTNQVAKLVDRDVWIMIGDCDNRVDTDRAIEFARHLSAEAARQKIPGRVELHVCPSSGHHTPVEAEEQSAAWMTRQLKK